MLAMSVSLGEALKRMLPQMGEPDTDVREVLTVSLDCVKGCVQLGWGHATSKVTADQMELLTTFLSKH